MKKLLTGNEAVARGAYEVGVHFASAYPGTPSTEILENIANYNEIYSEWAPNEKVALESAIGASVAGARSVAAMKHVGLNVAADPLFTFAYTGVNGGSVIITADEPGQHSAQNEQDNRNYARAAKVPMMEPSDSQESKDMFKSAFEISERFDTPVLFRMTTRVCHSKSIVECTERVEAAIKPYIKNEGKYVCVPANAKLLRMKLEERLDRLEAFSERSEWNNIEDNHSRIGVITSGACYKYAKEVFGEEVSYLKLGFTYPLPKIKIANFCTLVDTVYIIEENDPYIEDTVRMLGFDCKGKDILPKFGEMTPDIIRKYILHQENALIDIDDSSVVSRPPTLCAGCPHRGFFYQLAKRKNVMVSGDIGCYTLGYAKPYSAMDTCICMGASFSMGHGAQKVFNMNPNNQMRVVSVLGDSTFFHTGINSLTNVVYNNSNTISVILDNRITGMTGHQENPSTGYNIKKEQAVSISIEAVVKAIGIQHIKIVNPNDLAEMNRALDECFALDEPSVIITRWPCALKKFSPEDMQEFPDAFGDKYYVESEECIGCKLCLKAGCPALSFSQENKKAKIEKIQCLGCGVCFQICPKQAIHKGDA